MPGLEVEAHPALPAGSMLRRTLCAVPMAAAGKPAPGADGGAGDVALRGAGVAGSAMRVLDLFGCSIDYDRRGRR